MNLEKEQLKRLKEIELDMFREFLKICEKHKFRYFLLGGTALGAVRHKGFIPWDDDIDVGMPREDYDKFVSLAQEELPDHLFLQTHITDPAYPMNFAKIRNTNTTFIEISSQKIDMNHGVFIDIFPLDGTSENKYVRKIRRWKYEYLSVRVGSAFVLNHGKTGIKNLLLDLLMKGNYKKFVAKREKFLRRYAYADCNVVANYNGAWGEKEVMPKAYFGNGTKGTFEGIAVCLPENYDAYLSQMYGAYMTPPPIEKQIGHHYCTVIDMDAPYTVYIRKEENNEKSNNIRHV